MTKQELIDNGVTLKSITAMMRRAEKLISFFNNKYDYDQSLATDKEKTEWNSAISRHDIMKINII